MERKVHLEQAILSRVILSQFTSEMVPKYSSWLQNADLLEATSTESMSAEELLQICENWKNNPNEYTYIIFDKFTYDPNCAQASMIGDINIFIHEEVGEINMMIAEEAYRNKGIASEVLSYAKQVCKDILKLQSLVAKIKSTNLSSQRLFLKSGFTESCRISDFDEIHFICSFGV